jgi:single-stranded-DNA-specific exonuclease
MAASAKASSRRRALPGKWEIAAQDTASAALLKELSATLQISQISARILLRRGFTTLQSAGDFLARRMDLLRDPSQLPDMALAVARTAEAIEKDQRIVLFGDYDVDGVSSTALLARFLNLLKLQLRKSFEVIPSVPERKDGYGLSPVALKRILDLKPGLVITLDNGISAVEGIAELKRQGIGCIVLDHHQPGEVIPPADAVINPKRRDGQWAYPFTELCGAGVTYKFVWALAVHFSQNVRVRPEFRTFLLDAQALAALGTLADVVPLVDENRILAHYGLTALERTKMPGLVALREICQFEGRPRPNDISFRLAPRINAAGRCGQASEALELLLTDDPKRAAELAQVLDAHNTHRQNIELEILEQARAQALEQLQAKPDSYAFVLESADWHLGVIGIVASRIVEEFHRPAFLLFVDKEKGVAQGSGRSIRKLHLYDALHASSQHLRTFGGHAAAAGLTLDIGNISSFRSGFYNACSSMLTPEDLIPVLRVDEQVDLANVNMQLCMELDKFEPCGAGNPRPTLAVLGVTLPAPPKLMSNEKHISFYARQKNAVRRVIGFNAVEHFNTICDLSAGTLDLAFRLQSNTFRGETSAELVLEAFRRSID